MRVLHLSDPHIFDPPFSGRSTARPLEEQATDLRRLADVALDHAPDLILLTGDLYGRTTPHIPKPRERAVLEPFLLRCADVAPVVVLEGNHDHELVVDLTRHLGGAHPIRVITGAAFERIPTAAGPVDVYGLAYPTKRWAVAQAELLGLREAQDRVNAALATILRGWARRIERIRKREPEVPVIVAAHALIRGSVLAGGEVLADQEVEIPPELLTELGPDYGALGHVHQRQELAPRWWYVGDPWPVDFGEEGKRGWHEVEIGTAAEHAPHPEASDFRRYIAAGGLQHVLVTHFDLGSRPWITLDYRWAADLDGRQGRWVRYPTEAERSDVSGAHVRARLVVTDQAVAGCPWEAELESLAALGAHRVVPERTIEPIQRVRSPQAASAVTVAEGVRAYWGVLGTPPSAEEQEAALGVLGDLEGSSDDQIEARTRSLLQRLGVSPDRILPA